MKAGFQPGIMLHKYGNSSYQSPPRKSAPFPTARFLLATLFGPIRWLRKLALRKQADDYAWNYSSVWVGDLFEALGGQIVISGLENVTALKEPCVFIANHMSTLETFLLPAMIRPFMPVTFVVKKSLATMPVFGPIMRSRDPVVVKRSSPRDDLATVLDEGVKRLKSGISIVIFPQHTRSLSFDPAKFNSIGIKLALKGGAPVVPLALKTDAWGHGKRIKELGRIRPRFPARFEFGALMRPKGNGKAELDEIRDFIGKKVSGWQTRDGINGMEESE